MYLLFPLRDSFHLLPYKPDEIVSALHEENYFLNHCAFFPIKLIQSLSNTDIYLYIKENIIKLINDQ